MLVFFIYNSFLIDLAAGLSRNSLTAKSLSSLPTPFKEIMMWNLQGAEEQKTPKLPCLEKADFF